MIELILIPASLKKIWINFSIQEILRYPTLNLPKRYTAKHGYSEHAHNELMLTA